MLKLLHERNNNPMQLSDVQRITAALSELGRNAVPVYALYTPGESSPRLLPEVLTPSLVLEALSRLPPAKASTAITLGADPGVRPR